MHPIRSQWPVTTGFWNYWRTLVVIIVVMSTRFQLRSCSTSWYWRQHCCILCDFLLQSWHWQHWRQSPHLPILISNAVVAISRSTLTFLSSPDSSVGWSASQRHMACTVWKGTAPTTVWKSVPVRGLADCWDASKWCTRTWIWVHHTAMKHTNKKISPGL